MAQLIIEIPDELAARTVEAIRKTYPSLIPDDQTDAQAMRRIVAWWTANLLSQYEGEKVRGKQLQALEAAQQNMERAIERARGKAFADVQAAIDDYASPEPGDAGVA